MIQNPNIKFTDAATTYMKEDESKFPPFPNKKPVPNYGQCVGSKQGYSSLENEMDHKLSCRSPIWVIQRHNIKFTDTSTIYVKNSSPNSLNFPTENQSQILDSM